MNFEKVEISLYVEQNSTRDTEDGKLWVWNSEAPVLSLSLLEPYVPASLLGKYPGKTPKT